MTGDHHADQLKWVQESLLPSDSPTTERHNAYTRRSCPSCGSRLRRVTLDGRSVLACPRANCIRTHEDVA